jgi:hypothetical protein
VRIGMTGAALIQPGESRNTFGFLVAVATRGRRMFAAEEVARAPVRVSLDAEGLGAVALLACRSELRCVGILMTARAVSGQSPIYIPAIRPLRMTLGAGNSPVPAGEIEPRAGVIESHRRELCRIDGVAVGAPRKLPVVDVSMAGPAVRRQILVNARLNRTLMTLFAFHNFVLAAEESSKARMLVLRDPKGRGRMALLTLGGQLRPVRVFVTGHAL